MSEMPVPVASQRIPSDSVAVSGSEGVSVSVSVVCACGDDASVVVSSGKADASSVSVLPPLVSSFSMTLSFSGIPPQEGRRPDSFSLSVSIKKISKQTSSNAQISIETVTNCRISGIETDGIKA